MLQEKSWRYQIVRWRRGILFPAAQKCISVKGKEKGKEVCDAVSAAPLTWLRVEKIPILHNWTCIKF